MTRRLLTALTLLSLAGSASVRAETLLTGFGGVAFSGATERSRGTYGGSLGFVGSVVGFEAEFATTPDFFGSSSDSGAFTENDVVTLMGSLLFATPGNVRLYAAVGGGLMKTRLADPGRFFSIDSNDFGINVGGGIMGFFGEHVGLRQRRLLACGRRNHVPVLIERTNTCIDVPFCEDGRRTAGSCAGRASRSRATSSRAW